MIFRYYAKQNLIKRSYDLITDLRCIIEFDKKKYLIVEQLSDQNIYHTNKTITIYKGRRHAQKSISICSVESHIELDF